MGKAKISAVIALDGEKQFNAAVTSVNKDLTKLRSESKLIKEEFAGQANSLEALKAKHENLKKTLETHKKKVEAVNNGLKHAKDDYEKVGNKLEELEKNYHQAAEKMSEMEKNSDTTEEALEKQRAEVERLSKGLDKSRDNYKRAEERIKAWETKLNNAKAELIKSSNALKDNEKLMEEAKESTDKCAKSIDEYGKKTKIAVESTLRWQEAFKGSAAGEAVEQVTEKVIELGKEAANTAKEMESAEKQVQASTGASAEAAERYSGIMKELYAGNYGEGFDDISEALSTVRQNMQELSEVELKNITEDAITLRDTFGMDYQEQIRAAKMLMDTFGLSSKEAYNLIAQGAQEGLNKNGDMLDVINEYSVHYKNMGTSAEEFMNSLVNGTAAGTFSVDKLGDAYKEFGIRVKDTASSTTEAYELLNLDADEMRQKFAAGGESAKAATQEVVQALFGMDDQVKQNQAGVDLFGTMWEDMGMDAIQAITNLNGEMSVTENTMKSIKDIKYSDMGSQISEIAREIQMKLAEPLEKKWMPVVRDGLEIVSDNIELISTGTMGLASAAGLWKISQTKAGEEVIKVLKTLIFTRGADVTATGAQTVATGAQTIATKAATTAQTAFNAAMGMNPIAKIVLAIVAAAGAYKALEKAVVNSDAELKENKETVDGLCTEMDSLKQSTEEAQRAREESLEDIQAEYGAYEVMAEKLTALSEKENKTNGEKALMKSYIDQLNEAIPELNLAIDEQTGKLNLNSKSIQEVIKANKERLMVEAQESMMGEILQEQMQAEIELAKIQEARGKVEQKQKDLDNEYARNLEISSQNMERYGQSTEKTGMTWVEYKMKQRECKKELEKLDEELEEAQGTADEAADEYDKVAEAVGNVAEKNGIAAESAQQNGDASTQAAAKITEAYSEMEDGIKKSLEGTADIFDEFNAGQEVSTEEMLANLDSQEKGLTEWKDNLKILAGAAGQGMTEEFFQYLVQMGPQGANAVAELSAAFQNGEPEFKAICDKYKTVLKLEDETASQITGSYYDTGMNSAQGMKKGIEDGTAAAEEAARQMASRVMQAGKVTLQVNSPSKRMRNELGVWVPRGLAQGIQDATPEAEKSAQDMAASTLAAAQKELDIHSPSKKFQKGVGEKIPEGIAEGVKKKSGIARKETEKLTKDIHKSASKLAEAMEKKGNFGVSNKTKEGAKKSASKYSREVLEAATEWFGKYKQQHETTAEDEVTFWTKIRKQLKKGTAAYKEATQNIKDAKKTAAQEKLSASDKALSQYKVYYEVSAKAEVDYWNTVRKQFKKGTDERIEADQKYYEAKENLNSQLESLNEEYVQNCADVQQRLKDDIQSLTDEYNNAVKDRADSIYSSFNLFDEFQSQSASGATLLHNLKTQVAGIADWELQLENLTDRGLPTGLLDELKEMGPEASASLHALNSLTDEQLKEYADLWKQKKDLAQSQAVKDMEPMRQETQQEINTLVKEARQELKELKSGYDEAVSELNTDISSALKKVANSTKKVGEDATAELIAGIKKGAKKKSTKADLDEAQTDIKKNLGKLKKAGKEIGNDTLEGILKGLNNKKTMQKSAKQFIDDLKKEIQAAAEIHSPSRLFKREIGLQLPAGVGEGIEEGTKGAEKKGAEMVKDLLNSYKEQMNVKKQEIQESSSKLLENGITGISMKENAKNVINSYKEELEKQEKSLQEYRYQMSTERGVEAVNNLISAPVQQNTNINIDNSSVIAVMGEILSTMQQYLPEMADRQLVMDTGQTVGALSSGISAEFAIMSRRMRR